MCAIVDGDLYSWGKGVDGQLGHGNTKNISIPTKVNLYGNLSESVSCGTNHTLVLTRNNESDSELNEYSAYAFGNGIFGQLGSGSNRNSYSPVRVKLNAIEGLAAGDNHSLFLSHGKVYASGDNTIWQLGISSNKKYVLEPVELDILEPIVMVQARKISAGLTANGEVYVWGGKTNQPKPRKLKQVRTEPLNII